MKEGEKDLWWKPEISEKEKELTKKKIAETAAAFEDLAAEITLLKKKHNQLEKEDLEMKDSMQRADHVIAMTKASNRPENIKIAEFEEEKQEESRIKQEELKDQILDLEKEIKEKKEQLKRMSRIGKDTDYHILLDHDTKDELAPFREKMMEAKKDLDIINKVIETLTQRVEEKKEELDKYRFRSASERTQIEIDHTKSMINNFEKMIKTKEKERNEIANFYLDLKNKLNKLESRQPNIQ